MKKIIVINPVLLNLKKKSESTMNLKFSPLSIKITKLLSKDSKKNNGIFFTPPSIIIKLLIKKKESEGPSESLMEHIEVYLWVIISLLMLHKLCRMVRFSL